MPYTMCPMNCHPTYCGMIATRNSQGIVEIMPNRGNPDSRGFLCQRGHHVHEIIDHPSRLLFPLVRSERGATWRRASWDDVMTTITARLARPERVAVWIGHGAVVSDLNRPLVAHFADTLGLTFWDPAVVCWAAGAYGLATTGIVETNTKEDMGEHADCILLWGWNVASQPTTAPFLLKAKKRGAAIIAIDCRQSEASGLANEVVMIRPDTDAALALGMAHVIIRDGLVDREFIQQHTVGYEEFAQAAAKYSPEWTGQVTGLSPDHVVGLAHQYAHASAAIIAMGASSMFKGHHGWYASRAIACLPGLTGHVGKPGTGFGPRHRGFVQAQNYAGFSDQPPTRSPVSTHMDFIMQQMEHDAFDTLFVFGSNMLSSFADAGRLEAALGHVSCIVGHDIVLNGTMKRVADIALPGTVWIEELGLKATDTHVYLMDAVRPASGAARSMASVLKDCADRLGVPAAFPFDSTEAALNHMLSGLEGPVTVNRLRENGGQWSRNACPVGHSDGVFATRSGKIQFAAPQLERLGLPRLPLPQPILTNDRNTMGYPLSLLSLGTGRSSAAFHSFYDEGRMLSTWRQREPRPIVWVNADDAHQRRLSDGADIDVYNSQGVMRAQAHVSSKIVPGALWMRDGWWSLNVLTESTVPLSSDASGGLDPVRVGDTLKSIDGGQSSYVAMVEIRVHHP